MATAWTVWSPEALSSRAEDRSTPLPARAPCTLPFLLLLAVNATLLIRPAEIVPELAGLPIFQVLILASLALSLPAVAARLSPAALLAQPITTCVLGMMPFVLLSRLVDLNLGETIRCG